MLDVRVLVITDNDTASLAIHDQLLHLGYPPPSKASHATAQQHLRQEHHDLVLMDTVAAAGGNPPDPGHLCAWYHIPLLLMVPKDDPEARRLAATAGHHYVLTPCSEQELHIAILEALVKEAMAKGAAENAAETVAAVETERRRFTKLVDLLPAYLALMAPDHRMLFTNRFFRERFGDPQGRRCFEHLFRRNEPCPNCQAFKVLENGQPVEWEWLGPNNRVYHVSDFLYTDPEGCKLVVEMGIDITERKRVEQALQTAHRLLETRVEERTLELADSNTQLRAEIEERRKVEDALRESEARYRLLAEELRNLDQRKNEFLGVLSHELRNPLATIRANLQVIAQAVPGSEQDQRARAIIERQTDQLSHLVDDLLDMTRITQNKIHLKRQHVVLNHLVQRTVDDHRALFEANRIRLETELPQEEVYVHADATRLTQVVGNLLMNAMKFTDPGGYARVSLSVDSTQQQAAIRVADNGVGMSPATIARLFQPFMQADITRKRSQGGLGLGLALVKGFVELHGGEVRVHSAGLGKGTEFTVRLPLSFPPPEREQASPSASFGNRRILIIEDNVDLADTLKELLELHEHTVAVAYQGQEGLQTAREFQPEIVLCDIGLPDMDGYTLARAFRADDELKDRYLVALTGYALPEDQQRTIKVGFDMHLAKPPDFVTLERLLAQAPHRSAC